MKKLGNKKTYKPNTAMDEDAYRKKFSTECMDLLQVAISYLNPISRFRQKAVMFAKVVGAY